MKYQQAIHHFPNSLIFQAVFQFNGYDDIMPEQQVDSLSEVSVDVVIDGLGNWIYLSSYMDIIEIKDLYEMAKFGFNTTFISIRLTKSDKPKFSKWADETQDDLLIMLQAIVADDYKVSLSYDGSKDVFIASLTGKKEQRYNSQKCFTSRSSDLFEAYLLMIYKHMVLAKEGNWDTIKTVEDTWG